MAGLVTSSDLLATAKENPTKNEAQLSLMRMQNAASPMPPAALNLPATAAEIAALQSWINGGYAGMPCAPDAGPPVTGPALTVVDVFAAAPAYQAQTGSNAHNAGRNCMQCHATGNGDDAQQFMFGGTIYDGTGNALGGAEIRVVDTAGAVHTTYSGTNGTFHMTGKPLTSGAHVGARNATSKALMISVVTNGGCSSCHCTGAGCTTTAIHLP